VINGSGFGELAYPVEMLKECPGENIKGKCPGAFIDTI